MGLQAWSGLAGSITESQFLRGGGREMDRMGLSSP